MKYAALLLVFATSFSAMGLDYAYSEKKVYKQPVREQALIVSKEGFYPQNIVAFTGEKVRLFLTTTTDEPSCFIFPEKKVFVSAQRGKIAEDEFEVDKAGVYEFHCPTGKIKGTITVLEKESERRKRIDRSMASKQVIKVWRPKDYPTD